MNELTVKCFLEHSGFDKLKYNLAYYREHVAEKKAYNKKYYQENKDKWGIDGNTGKNSIDSKSKAKIEAERQADAKKLTGYAREHFIKSYMQKHGSQFIYDEPIGPSPRKASSIEKAVDKVFSHIPGYAQLYNGSIYNFLNSGKQFIKNVMNIGERSKAASNFVDRFSDEDLKNIKNKLNDMQKKLNAIESKADTIKTKVQRTVNQISF